MSDGRVLTTQTSSILARKRICGRKPADISESILRPFVRNEMLGFDIMHKGGFPDTCLRRNEGDSTLLKRFSPKTLKGTSVKRLFITLGCLSLLIVASSSLSSARWLFQAESGKKVLTNADLIELSQSGLSDSAIVEKIRCSQTNFKTGPDDLKHLRSNGVSESLIREMRRNPTERRSINCRERSSSGALMAPQGVTRSVNSEPTQLTPAQLKRQEDATARANPPVPISSGATERVPDSRSPSQQPVTTPVVTAPRANTGPLRPAHKRKKKRRNKMPRKGNPS